MAIFYMDVKIIGRSSGRSATGAAAYRSGEKLQSVAHASYQSGEKLQGKSGKITHDYRKKKGVVHSEILLPDNAPEEYRDRQTLWNTVELNEKRKDAQLAREIIFALPREFDLPEQIQVMREYVQENFVSKGMIADFALHDTGEGNPHAHIMLTMRNVSRNGFGYKNTDWNKKDFLLSYRKAWTHIINNALKRKGLDIRIDHRSYKEQGLDRLSTIHLGHEAAALEKKGIATQRGDYNREIKRRNTERAIKEAELLKEIHEDIKELQQTVKAMQQQLATANIEPQPNEIITKLKTVNRVNELPENPNVPDNQPSAPRYKFPDEPSFVKKGQRSAKVRERQLALTKELRVLRSERGELEREFRRLEIRAEKIDEEVKNIQTLNTHLTQIQREYQGLRPILDRKRKKELKKEIEHIERNIRSAKYHFKENYHVTPDEVSVEIARTRAQMDIIKSSLEDKNTKITKLLGKLQIIEHIRSEHEHKIKRKTMQQPEQQRGFEPVEQYRTHGIEHRRSVPKVMRELRKELDEATKRRRRRKALAKKKPWKISVIEPLPQKRLHRDEYYLRKTKKIEHHR